MTTKRQSTKTNKATGTTKKQTRHAADDLTAERIRAILADPQTPEGVKDKLRGAVSKLIEWAHPEIRETPDFMAQAFAEAAEKLRVVPAGSDFHFDEARPFHEQTAGLAERHEPQAHKVARRCVEIYDDWLGRKNGRRHADGAYYFMEHVDAVLEGGDGLLPNPGTKYFVPLFVEAFDERGPRDHHVRKLLDLIKRVDEGADLNALRDEAERASREREEAHRPPDARLVDALAAVIADRKRQDDHTAILDALNDLSNRTIGVYDFHPELFPVLARVVIREARRSGAAKGRGRVARLIRENLRQLEEIAGR